jgi:hypothetical protein
MFRKTVYKPDAFDFEYFKYKNSRRLTYLFKIVHNIDMAEKIDNNNVKLNDFYLFVWNVSLRLKQSDPISKKKKNVLTDKQTDELLYLYFFLKDYDADLFKNLTMDILRDYLLRYV